VGKKTHSFLENVKGFAGGGARDVLLAHRADQPLLYEGVEPFFVREGPRAGRDLSHQNYQQHAEKLHGQGE